MVGSFSPALNAARMAFPLPAVTPAAPARPSCALTFASFSGLVARSTRALACSGGCASCPGPPLRTASLAIATRRRSKSVSLSLASEPSRSPGKRTGSVGELPRVTGVDAEAAAWLNRSGLSIFEQPRRILEPYLTRDCASPSSRSLSPRPRHGSGRPPSPVRDSGSCRSYPEK